MKALKIVLLLVISLAVLALTSNINPEKTISEKVAEKEDLSTLLTALEAADLVEVLKGEGPYTVFAPTNKAFENLPEGKLDNLLKAENKEELIKILKYHVVADKIHASDIGAETMVETLEGTQLKLTAQSTSGEYMGEEAEAMNRVMVNNAAVTETDIMASNGIIHVIDSIVMPADMEVMGAANNN
ncbi:fasciclin domain-containing protein [Fodinibius sp. Rm-B-1B1-1]|uniref:fasciclin domain-containing protein n=1 Tax=Fodinibius alkaliphilus TaxID=3140241 RepID=UPI00315B00BC